MDGVTRRPLPTRDAVVELTTVLADMMEATLAQANAVRALTKAVEQKDGSAGLAVPAAIEVLGLLEQSTRHVGAANRQLLAVLDAMAGDDG